MRESLRHFEHQRLLQVAEEYRHEGYDVSVYPSPSELPEFLLGYHPDLIARGPDETVVVEVRSRNSLVQSQELPTLAGILADRPSWRFELVVANPRGRGPGIHESLSSSDIRARLQDVDKLLASNSIEAALLVCWAAAEALVRLGVIQEDVDLEGMTPLRALKTSFSLGFLSRADYKVLERAYELRNRISHGYTVPKGQNRVTPAFVRRLAKIVRQSLDARESRLQRWQQFWELSIVQSSLQNLLITFPGMAVRTTAKDVTVGTGHYVWAYMQRLVRTGELRVRFAVPSNSAGARRAARQLKGVRARVIELSGKRERLELLMTGKGQIAESGLEALLPALYQEFRKLPGRNHHPISVADRGSRKP